MLGIVYKSPALEESKVPTNYAFHYNENLNHTTNDTEYKVVFTSTEAFRDQLQAIVDTDERLMLAEIGEIRKASRRGYHVNRIIT